MFYIKSKNGISVTEQGRAPLFIPKTHPNYESVLKNIDKMDYNAFAEAADDKSNVVGYINEYIESFENEDGDFEVRIVPTKFQDALSALKQQVEEINLAMDPKDPCFKKAQMLTNILKNSRVSSIRLVLN